MSEEPGGKTYVDDVLAFPSAHTRAFGTAYERIEFQTGMTLRDWFAGQALIGIVSQGSITETPEDRQTIANVAYEIADAMLKAREAK